MDVGLFLLEPAAYLCNSTSFGSLAYNWLQLHCHFFFFLTVLDPSFSQACRITASTTLRSAVLFTQTLASFSFGSQIQSLLLREASSTVPSKAVHMHNLTLQSYLLQISSCYPKWCTVGTLLSFSPIKIEVLCELWLSVEQSLTYRRRSINICWMNKWILPSL